MRISDWSSDVCSSDLVAHIGPAQLSGACRVDAFPCDRAAGFRATLRPRRAFLVFQLGLSTARLCGRDRRQAAFPVDPPASHPSPAGHRSEEHTSELQSLMRISYAVFCLKKTTIKNTITNK